MEDEKESTRFFFQTINQFIIINYTENYQQMNSQYKNERFIKSVLRSGGKKNVLVLLKMQCCDYGWQNKIICAPSFVPSFSLTLTRQDFVRNNSS